MIPAEPTTPKGVMIGDVEAQLSQAQPSTRRGDSTTLDVRLQFLEDSDTESERYHRLKDYQEYAGEASFGNQLGGKPHLREHPQEYWAVDSHVVPIVFGEGIFESRDFWGLINGVDDSGTIIVGDPGPTGGGNGDTGDPVPSPNHYRLDIEVVPLADIGEYDDREELLADLSPVLNQL